METLGDLRQALQDDLSVETTDVFYSETLLNRYINRAYRAIANLHPWQETQRGLKRSSIANQEYLTYPNNLRTDSVFFITVDGVEHKLIQFREFERHKEANPGNTKKLASDWRRKLFIHPTPTTDGNGNVKVWGHEVPDELASDSDQHIFGHQSVLEEAIFMYANGLALMKGRGTHYERGKALLGDAITMANNEWEVQKQRQAEYRTEATQMWENYDLLDETGQTRRATFETYNN